MIVLDYTFNTTQAVTVFLIGVMILGVVGMYHGIKALQEINHVIKRERSYDD